MDKDYMSTCKSQLIQSSAYLMKMTLSFGTGEHLQKSVVMEDQGQP